MQENIDLIELYRKAVKNLISTEYFDIQPTHPLMLSVPQNYDKKIKVMLFGQETNGWQDDLGYDPEKTMERYDRFWIEKKSNFSKVGSFLQVLNSFQKMLGINEYSCIWNNIIKIGKKDDKGLPPEYIINWQEEWFNVIAEEVGILKPDLIIFFTGPNYDKYIEKALGQFTTSQVLGRKVREIAKLNFSDYNEILAFRTYHPSYLRRKGLEKEFLEYFKQQAVS